MNNIDKNFREKLKELEVQPSDRANQLFMSKIEMLPEERKLGTWKYFALAASVLLVFSLMFGQLFTSQTSNTAILEPNDRELTTGASEEVVEPSTIIEADNEPIEKLNTSKIASSLSPIKTVNLVEVKDINSEIVIEPVVTKNVPDEVLQRKIPEIKLKKLAGNKNYDFAITNLTDYSILDVHAGTLDLKPETNLAFEKSIEVKEKPLFAKLFNEVKYVLNGEKLDLDRAGIAPAFAVLAYNENNLIASESRQFKQGINRLKEVLK